MQAGVEQKRARKHNQTTHISDMGKPQERRIVILIHQMGDSPSHQYCINGASAKIPCVDR